MTFAVEGAAMEDRPAGRIDGRMQDGGFRCIVYCRFLGRRLGLRGLGGLLRGVLQQLDACRCQIVFIIAGRFHLYRRSGNDRLCGKGLPVAKVGRFLVQGHSEGTAIGGADHKRFAIV